MDFTKRRENYLIAVYILLPTFLLALLILLLYIYCSKRYKLNWYEKTLLEEHDRCTTIDKSCVSVSVDTVNSNSSLTPLIHNEAGSKGVTSNTSINTCNSNAAALLIKPTVGSSTCSVSSEKRDSKGSLIAEWLPGNLRMGSSPSSPVKDVSQKFWVPPAVIERKRAQSLVPSLTQIDSDDDQSSGTVTPSSMSGAREPSFSFPGDSRGSVTSNDIPFIPGQRPRRASMQDAIDLKKIDTKLYDRKLLRQQSLSSGEEENLGAVNCSLHYNKETHLLAVNIIQAVDLVPKDFSGTANPYCKVSLLPVHRSQLQTKVHHKTLEPKFDEEFIFDVSPQKLKSCCLEILIFNYDQFSRHECVGQVKLMLENIDLTEKVDLWKGISHYEKQKSKDQRDIGDVMFSLSYLSSAERLTVVIIKARNLRHSEDGKNTDNKTADPFVKVSVILKGRKIKKKKTSTVHSSLNPVWNEALSFSIARDIVKDVSLELTVCHENKLGNDDILGHVRLSADADGDERVHWNDLVSFRSAVARWHTLL